jgi:starvation-inducible DNA-binding protein
MKNKYLGLPSTRIGINNWVKYFIIKLSGLLQNLREDSTNIRGKRFFDLHVKFEELTNDSKSRYDCWTRSHTLGGTIKLHTLRLHQKTIN